MISKQIKELLAKEIRSKSEVDEIVSHLVAKHIRTGKLEFSYAVKVLLRQCFTPEEIKRKSIARKVFTSERNLVRKLKKEGVNYRQLVDEVRKERCMALMQQGATATGELTRQLCYSDSSYVYRAFRRWTGIGLAEAKRILAQNPNELVSIFHSAGKSGDDMLNPASIPMHSRTLTGDKTMRELTVRETEKVGGGWGVPGAIIGAATGAASYLGTTSTSGRFSWRNFAYNTAAGAVTGAIGGPMGVARAYFLPRAAFFMGAIYGLRD